MDRIPMVIFLLVFGFSPMSLSFEEIGESGLVEGGPEQTTSTSTVSNRNDTNGGATESVVAEEAPLEGGGAYNEANNAQNSSNMFAMAGMGIAMMNLPKCGVPGGQAACAVGVAGIGLAALSNAKANEAASVKAALSGVSVQDQPGTGDQAAIDTANIGNQLSQLQTDAAQKGISVGADGSVTLPNGESLTPSQMTAEGFQDAFGLSAEDAESAFAEFESAINKAKDSDGGGSGGAASGLLAGLAEDAEAGEDLTETGYTAGLRRKKKRDPASEEGAAIASLDLGQDDAQWSGVFKKYGTTKVGVKQSDLFRMVENRVNKERKRMGE